MSRSNGILRVVRASGAVRWRIRWVDAHGKRRGEVYGSEAAARAALRRRQVDVDNVRSGRVTARITSPTLANFQIDFMATYVAANNKPSERIAKDCMLRHHIVPAFGALRLDEITGAHVEKFKAEKLAAKLAPKTINNLLTCLGKMLRFAADAQLVEKLPRIKFLKVFKKPIDFLTYDETSRLIAAAASDPEALAALLCGVDAGMRVGEIRALEWGDLDLVAAKVIIQRTDYRGHKGSPKGGRTRTVPLTRRLVAAMKAARHLRGDSVFSDAAGALWSRGEADTRVRRACRRAGLRKIGWHTLRHTFCSHLAMRGAPVRTIQELAGHASITTTMGYMHLTPAATREAIALLETQPDGPPVDRDVVSSLK